jgi:hypothetical protein
LRYLKLQAVDCGFYEPHQRPGAEAQSGFGAFAVFGHSTLVKLLLLVSLALCVQVSVKSVTDFGDIAGAGKSRSVWNVISGRRSNELLPKPLPNNCRFRAIRPDCGDLIRVEVIDTTSGPKENLL